ncbi:MAG: hypothetical protein AAFO69_03075 [Bacteroidota bacterium]
MGGNNINNKIQKKLDQLEYPFEESSWEAMDALLDAGENQPVASFWQKGKFLAVMAILLVGTTAITTLAYEPTSRWIESLGFAAQRVNYDTGKGIHLALYDQEIDAAKSNLILNTVKIQEAISNDRKETAIEKSREMTMHKPKDGREATDSRSPKKTTTSRLNRLLSDADLRVPSVDVSENKVQELLQLQSRNSPIVNLLADEEGPLRPTFDNNQTAEESASAPTQLVEEEQPKITKGEKKQERANARQVRKMLGKQYRTTKIGGFSLLPANYGIRLGTNSVKNSLTGAIPSRVLQSGVFDGFNPITGFNAAIYLQYYLGKNYRLQVDLGISALDFTGSYIGFGGGQYVNSLPVYQYDFRTEEMVFKDLQLAIQQPLGEKGVVELGGFIGLVSDKSTLDETIDWNPNTLRPAPRLVYPRPYDEVSFGALIGYERQLWGRLSVSGRYFFGVTNLINPNFTPLRFRRVRASRFQFGLKFQINRLKTVED